MAGERWNHRPCRVSALLHRTGRWKSPEEHHPVRADRRRLVHVLMSRHDCSQHSIAEERMKNLAGSTRLLRRMAAVLCFAVLLTGSQVSADELVKAGTISIDQVQIAFIGSANLGGGTLN